MKHDAELHWQPSAHGRRALTIATLALVLGLALGRPAVIAVAAAPLAYLLVGRARLPGRLSVETTASTERCFEHEPVELCLVASVTERVDALSLRVRPDGGITTSTSEPIVGVLGLERRDVSIRTQVTAARWGHRRLGCAVADLHSAGQLVRARVEVRLDELVVYPTPTPTQHRLAMPVGHAGSWGDHPARVPGPGLEPIGIRPFTPGDSVTRVNWRASARRGGLYVTETTAERAVDVVVAVDAFDDVGPAGDSTLDRTLRGATGLARLLLRGHDRVGIVAVGGWLRWLRPDSGERQFYRVADAMLDMIGRESYLEPDLRKLPAAALPIGSIIVMFSPLLDDRALRLVEQLRESGHAVIVVDVLAVRPAAKRRAERLAARLWRLDRQAARSELATIGVPVVTWDARLTLDVALTPVLRLIPAVA